MGIPNDIVGLYNLHVNFSSYRKRKVHLVRMEHLKILKVLSCTLIAKSI